MKIKALKLFLKKALKVWGPPGKYPLFPSPPSVGLCTWESLTSPMLKYVYGSIDHVVFTSCHTYVGLRMRKVVRLMHNIYAVHIRRNSVHCHSKLLLVKWLGLSVTVRVRARDGEWLVPLFILKSD